MSISKEPICKMNSYSSIALSFLLGRGRTALTATVKMWTWSTFKSLQELLSCPAFDFVCWRDTSLITKVQRSHGCEWPDQYTWSSEIKGISELIQCTKIIILWWQIILGQNPDRKLGCIFDASMKFFCFMSTKSVAE